MDYREGDPLELRDQHGKAYIEKSLKKRIQKYQHAKGFLSFSDAGRELWIKQLETEGF